MIIYVLSRGVTIISQIAAAASVGGAQFLSMGSAALSTAAQMTTLAANIKNAGGYAQILQGTMTILSAPFHGIGVAAKSAGLGLTGMGRSIIGLLPQMGAWIASTWAAAAANIAAFWPVYLIIGGIALLATGAVLLVKHWNAVSAFFVNLWGKITGAFSAAWNWIKGLLGGVPNWVLGLVAVFMPFIGIPLLIIKNWDGIKAFFASLWAGIQSGIAAFIGWLGGVWVGAVRVFTTIWNALPVFFASLWQGIVSIVLGVVNWINGVWTIVVSVFTTAWTAVYTFFASLWQGIVSIVLGVVDLSLN